MEIKCVGNGSILFGGRYKTVRRCAEAAVRAGASLKGADLRRACLRHAQLDGADLEGACLWGANLTAANLAGAVLDRADARAAVFKDSCLAEASLIEADLRGAYFSGTIVRAADLRGALFSCPSIFSADLAQAHSVEGAVYYHLGETACLLKRAPLVVSGLGDPLVCLDDRVLFRGLVNPLSGGEKEARALKEALRTIEEYNHDAPQHG